MPARIGFLAIGHPDYQNNIGVHFAGQAVARLREAGMDVVFDENAHTGAIEAGAAARELIKQDIDGVILWLGTWIECSTASAAIREFEHLPFAIWGFNMFQWEGQRDSTGSFVAACVLKGALDRMNYRYKLIVGLPEDDRALAAAAAFCQAAHTIQRLKRTRLGLIGYAAMAMYPGTFDHVLLRRFIGPEVVHIDTYSLIRRMESLDDAKVRQLEDQLRGEAEVAVEDHRLSKASRMAAALKDIAADLQLDAMNVKCQYELSQEFGMTACVPISVLADAGVVSACEGDAIITSTMCLLHYLSGQIVYYGDILDLQDNQMLLSSCGFAPMSLAHEHPRICELGHPGFDGIICSFTLKRGPVTFARLVEGRGDYRLNYGTGTGVDTQLRQGRFPGLEVVLDGSPEKLMATMASQHFAICYGDYTEAIEDLCRALDIEAVRI
jgi:L-fucose isomerase-like protein